MLDDEITSIKNYLQPGLLFASYTDLSTQRAHIVFVVLMEEPATIHDIADGMEDASLDVLYRQTKRLVSEGVLENMGKNENHRKEFVVSDSIIEQFCDEFVEILDEEAMENH